MTVQILLKDKILLKDSFEIWELRRGDGPGGEVGSSSKVSLWLQLEIDTEDFMNQYIIMVSMAKQVYLLAYHIFVIFLHRQIFWRIFYQVLCKNLWYDLNKLLW